MKQTPTQTQKQAAFDMQAQKSGFDPGLEVGPDLGWLPALAPIKRAGLRERFDHAEKLIEFFKMSGGEITIQINVAPLSKAKELAEIIRELKPELLTILAGEIHAKKHFKEYLPPEEDQS